VLQQEKGARQISGLGFVLAVYATSRIFYLVSGFLLAKFVPTSSEAPPRTAEVDGWVGRLTCHGRVSR
jgi:hypothetical protein